MGNNGLEFLDILTIASFILQVQNSESHKIDQLQNEVSQQNKVMLNEINRKLDMILDKLK